MKFRITWASVDLYVRDLVVRRFERQANAKLFTPKDTP